jgi:hypothetical protein
MMGATNDLILDYAERNEVFDVEKLWEWVSRQSTITRSYLNCLLSRLVRAGKVCRVSRGLYAAVKDKQLFQAVPTKSVKSVYKYLHTRLPFTPFCVYSGEVLSPLQHHLSMNATMYVEADRSAVEAVFNLLQAKHPHVWMTPDGDFVARYISLSESNIIVKPLVTESPLETVDGVPSPTLEKLLVDIKKDADFAYLQGVEAEYMWENAQSLYLLNQTRLRRYARRRALKIGL